MLEANPCLWDVYHTDYTNSGIKEIACTEIATSEYTNIDKQLEGAEIRNLS